MVHWVSGGLSMEQKLAQAQQTNEELTRLWREEKERHDKLRAALQARMTSWRRGILENDMAYAEEIQRILDGNA